VTSGDGDPQLIVRGRHFEFQRESVQYGRTRRGDALPEGAQVWADDRLGPCQERNWRLVASGAVLRRAAAGLAWQTNQSTITRGWWKLITSVRTQAVCSRKPFYRRPIRNAFHLARFIEDVRG